MDQIYDAIVLAKVKNNKALCVVRKQLQLEDMTKVGKSKQDRGLVFYLNEYNIGNEFLAYDVLDMERFNPTSKYENSLVLSTVLHRELEYNFENKF